MPYSLHRTIGTLLGIGLLGFGVLGISDSVMAQRSPRYTCPAEVEPLVKLMLRDLPGYANRVTNRLRTIDTGLRSYVVLAGRPEFEPLPLAPEPIADASDPPERPQQVFITTLERQYQGNQFTSIQQYHWLFFTQTSEGWYLALSFTRTGGYPANQPPTPPRDSSDGVIAQAIRRWLRDCRAGAVRTIDG